LEQIGVGGVELGQQVPVGGVTLKIEGGFDWKIVAECVTIGFEIVLKFQVGCADIPQILSLIFEGFSVCCWLKRGEDGHPYVLVLEGAVDDTQGLFAEEMGIGTDIDDHVAEGTVLLDLRMEGARGVQAPGIPGHCLQFVEGTRVALLDEVEDLGARVVGGGVIDYDQPILTVILAFEGVQQFPVLALACYVESLHK
jgi:hypothetical protein